MTKMPHQSLVMAAVLFTSASSIFIRLSIMPPLVIAFYRMAISTGFMAVPLLWHKNQLSGISRRDLLLCGLSGLALALHFATWIASLSMTTVMASTVLVSCSPIFVALINAAFFRKKPGKILLLCLGTAFAGTVIITMGAGDGEGLASLSGNLLALAGAVTVSFYLIIGQDVRKRVPTASYSFFGLRSFSGFSVYILHYICPTAGTIQHRRFRHCGCNGVDLFRWWAHLVQYAAKIPWRLSCFISHFVRAAFCKHPCGYHLVGGAPITNCTRRVACHRRIGDIYHKKSGGLITIQTNLQS